MPWRVWFGLDGREERGKGWVIKERVDEKVNEASSMEAWILVGLCFCMQIEVMGRIMLCRKHILIGPITLFIINTKRRAATKHNVYLL